MPKTSRAAASSPSRRRSASDKIRESGPRRTRDLSAARLRQHRVIFEHMARAASSPATYAEVGAIVYAVYALSYYYSFTPLEWDGLSPEEKLRFYQIAGTEAGCNVAWTFNISNEQRRAWQANSRFDDLADAFDHMVVRPVKDLIRRKFGHLPPAWYVVEPMVWRGRTGRKYQDTDDQVRRFGVHAAIGLRTLDELREFERMLWSKVDMEAADSKYAIELRPSGGFEGPVVDELWWRWFLKEQRKPEWKRDQTISRHDEEYTPAYWSAYSTKALALTTTIHADVCGLRPYGATQDLQSAARTLYRSVRTNMLARTKPLPAHIRSDLDAMVSSFLGIRGTSKHFGHAEAADWAIDYALSVGRAVPDSAIAPGDSLTAPARSVAGVLAEMIEDSSAGV